MSSSPSWTSLAPPDDRVSPSRLRASPSPLSSWSSDSEDRLPLSRLPAPGRAPARGRRTRAGVLLRAGAESPEGTASTVSGHDLARIRARYHVPQDVGLFLPTPEDRVISSRPGRVAMYEISLRLGLRFPFHPFYINLLDYYSLTPAQLVPNSLRTVCAFIILCDRLHVTPRLSLFRCFYILRQQRGWWLFQPRAGRVLKLLLPSSVKGWKSRFFFADLDSVKPRWGNPDLRPNTNTTVLPGDQEAMGQLLTADIPRYTMLLSEENLRRAGIILQIGE